MSAHSELDEISSWLRCALVAENLTDFSVKVVGNSEKGDGYTSDIFFVKVEGKTTENKSKTYDLVMKCSKDSQALRESAPMKATFENEIQVYSEVFPAFTKFQQERGVQDVFSSVPEYFGKFLTDNREVLVLQNMKAAGYTLHDRKKTLNMDHIKLMMREYGKWHAISAAMQDQEPEAFAVLLEGMIDVWKQSPTTMDMEKFWTAPVDEIYDLVQDDLTESKKQKLKKFKTQINYIMGELINDRTRFSVISHGDNWNNNLMFKYEGEDQNKPTKVAMLDWQISKFTSPVTDLSYFLYSCSSPEILKKFHDILKEYYASFSSHLKKLGSDPEKMFPYLQLLEDWKEVAKFGVMLSMVVIKVALTDKDEVKDFAETAESGDNIMTTFIYDIKDKDTLKYRISGVIEHAIEHGVL